MLFGVKKGWFYKSYQQVVFMAQTSLCASLSAAFSIFFPYAPYLPISERFKGGFLVFFGWFLGFLLGCFFL